MNVFESVIYFILFLLNKYLGLQFIEDLLNSFENNMIRRHLSEQKLLPRTIPTIHARDLTDELFLKYSNNYRNPVLIKGFMKNSNACKWNIDSLNSKIGNFKLNVVSKKDNKINITHMPFHHYAANKNNGYYVNNNHTILSNFPTLFDDVKPSYDHLLSILKSSNLRNIHIGNLFIGYSEKFGQTGSNLHCGGSGNFFCMLKGRKKWTLISPKYSYLLKGRVSSSGIHGQSLFEMGDSSLEKTPEIYEYLPRYEVVLEPGDVLWNAPWWWHRIQNLPGETIGLAIRNNKVTWLNLRNNLTYTLSGHTYLLYNSLVLNLYERTLNDDQHFEKSKTEDEKDNVLYQINDLMNKYPKSVSLDEIYPQRQKTHFQP